MPRPAYQYRSPKRPMCDLLHFEQFGVVQNGSKSECVQPKFGRNAFLSRTALFRNVSKCVCPPNDLKGLSLFIGDFAPLNGRSTTAQGSPAKRSAILHTSCHTHRLLSDRSAKTWSINAPNSAERTWVRMRPPRGVL